MLVFYSFLFTLAFLLMLPLLLLRREKYAPGFKERLGNYSEFKHDGRAVIWLHCVSVGETNAARPLVEALKTEFPDHRLVISTTTKTGQTLARHIFKDKADVVFYFPFDWKFTVRRALGTFKPALVLLMEAEIWPRFIGEAKLSGANVAIVNGRLSERSFKRLSLVKRSIASVLSQFTLALMQTEEDAERIKNLGMDPAKVTVTGNLKFEHSDTDEEAALTDKFRNRFLTGNDLPLVAASSTHEPEERLILESLEGILGNRCRLLIAPRHPQRFETVAALLRNSNYSCVRRSEPRSEKDTIVDVILLDTIGELRAAYPLADIVFVGGSLVPHGGQSIIEPAASGKAIVNGPYTKNFDAAVRQFLAKDALIQIAADADESQMIKRLNESFSQLLNSEQTRAELGEKAAAVMREARQATENTIRKLKPLL